MIKLITKEEMNEIIERWDNAKTFAEIPEEDKGFFIASDNNIFITLVNECGGCYVEEFYSLELPLMVGISRKSFLGITSENNELKDSITAALNYPLMLKGVDYLRVHNVKLHKQLLNQVI